MVLVSGLFQYSPSLIGLQRSLLINEFAVGTGGIRARLLCCGLQSHRIHSSITLVSYTKAKMSLPPKCQHIRA